MTVEGAECGFDEETYQQVKYARSQRKVRFTKNQPPDKLWETFKAKFGDIVLIGDWLFGATFGGDTEYHRQLYLEYLERFAPANSPKTANWIKFHIELEFGKPGRQYRTGKGKTQQGKLGPLHKQEWWQILGISATDDWSIVKQAYRSLALKYHPDTSEFSEIEATEMMKLINWAFDRAKEARERLTLPPNLSIIKPSKLGIGALVVSLDEPHLGVGKVMRHDPADQKLEWDVHFEWATRWLPTSALQLAD